MVALMISLIWIDEDFIWDLRFLSSFHLQVLVVMYSVIEFVEGIMSFTQNTCGVIAMSYPAYVFFWSEKHNIMSLFCLLCQLYSSFLLFFGFSINMYRYENRAYFMLLIKIFNQHIEKIKYFIDSFLDLFCVVHNICIHKIWEYTACLS